MSEPRFQVNFTKSLTVYNSTVLDIKDIMTEGITSNISDSNVFSMESDQFIEATHIIRHVILPIICAGGILGIILTIIVLSHKNMSTSTNCYLMALAIADLIFLVLLIPRLAENQFKPPSQPYYTFLVYATYSTDIGNICLLASIWITVMLAVERYIAICRPFLAAKLCSVTRARLVIIIIFVTVTFLRLINFWQYRVKYQYDDIKNNSVHFIQYTDFSYSVFWLGYAWLVDCFIASVIPFIILLLTNALLIYTVRKSTRYIQSNQLQGNGARKTPSNAQKEELQITIMLISVIVIFFVCQAPYVIYVAMASTNNVPVASFVLFRDIAMLLLTFKSAINFLIYCWFSERFRATLKRTFCTKRCLDAYNKNDPNSSYYSLRRMSASHTQNQTV